jgi:hypothetical protein
VFVQGQASHFFISDSQRSLKGLFDEKGFHLQTGGGLGVTNAGQHQFKRGERRACPSFADFAKQTMFNGIPFGSTGRIVTDGI